MTKKEDLEVIIRMLEGVEKRYRERGEKTAGLESSIQDLRKRLRKYQQLVKVRPLLPAQPKRNGLQYVAKGHVFPRDRYRPSQPEIFDGARHNHLGPTCMDCGKHRCQGCYPEFLTEKCPGPKDVWPT